MNKKMKFITIIFVSLALIYLLITFILYFSQRNLLYHPQENNYFGDQLTVEIEKVKILTEDNFELLAWYHEKDIINYKTILYFHGNAGSLENRIHKINNFENININFLLLSWRGFSGNKVKPTEQGLYKDAYAAINWLKNKGIKEEVLGFLLYNYLSPSRCA